MASKKSVKFSSVFTIFFSSIKTYFLYLDQTTKALAFPILGQIITLIILGYLTYLFNTNTENIKNIAPFFESDKNRITLFFVVLLPFILVFVKAFYDYIIALASMNILFFTNSKKKKAKNIDFKANNNVIQRKLFNYVILLLLLNILIFVPILGIYICLALQVFSLEGEGSSTKSIFRSIELVKGNFWKTLVLLLLCYFSTYEFLPSLFIWASEKISLQYFMINNIENFAKLFPYENLNLYLSLFDFKLDAITVAKFFAEGIIQFIIISFTMPFRCCCFTELYRLYDSEKIKENSKQTDEIIRRATGKKGKS